MLQSIRERASGWIAWVVFGLICIPFALWGVHQYFGADPDPAVARVNDTAIGVQQFQRAYTEQRQRLREALGANFDETALDPVVLRDATLEQLVANEALIQEALARGLRISDEQVASTIRSESTFNRDGAFSQPAYQAWLRNQGFSSASFEFRLRRDLLADQLAAGVAQTAFVTKAAASRMAGLLRQRRTYATLTLPLHRYMPDTVADEAVSRYYAEHKADFVAPEQVVVKYVLLSRAALAATVDVDEQVLKQRYEQQKASFSAPEQRRVSHILLQVPPDASESDVEAVMTKARALRDRIVGGEAFASVAAEVSEDPGSAAQGGDLGYFGRGVMDKSFEDAAFSQSVDVVGEPVRSDFGVHLILVTDVKAGGVKPYSEVRSQLLAAYQDEETEQRYFEQVERLANLTFEHPDSLEPAAETLGLSVRSSERISRRGSDSDELMSLPEVLRAAFSDDVLEQGNNSQPIDLGDGRVVVLRVDERIPSAPQTLEEAREDIVRVLRREAGEAALTAAAEDVLARLRAGEDRSRISSELGFDWIPRGNSARTDGGADAAVVETAFRMQRPAPGASVFDAVTTTGGDLAVIALDEVSNGDEEAGQEAQVAQAVAQGRGRFEFRAYVDAVRDEADVRIFQETLSNAL